ncbi:MAG: DnaB-like helicase C-terminal domain-containing protein [Candidatus Omnitrophica bacterium]|nr:DnaB-like helicase C-terminal domain-containing protein [Candidatus Omnitrophota bacterium]
MNTFQTYLTYGLSVIPCKDKKPEISWKEFQARRASQEEANRWNAPQVACICGKVSAGLLCIDFDIKNGDQYEPWCVLVNQGKPELFSKLVIEQSPSGGFHVVFRTDRVTKNVKLACNKENLCTIETRGEGGYFVCAPSPGYVLQFGDFSNIGRLSIPEAEFLLSAAVSLNEAFQENKEPEPTRTASNSQGLSPFDDFDSRENPCGLLEKHGWKTLFTSGTTTFLKRPGKEDRGISATWNKIPNRFYCFTTSTQFINQTVYKASAIYAILEHGGDYSAAAKALLASGYGEKQTRNEPPAIDEPKKIELIDTKDILNKIMDIKINGYRKGKTTGWKSLDRLFSVVKRQFTVITGVPSAGKSEFMDALAVNLVMKDRWKFAVFSPENYPAEMHYHKLIEKMQGCELRDIEDETIELTIKAIGEHFFFIDALEDDISLESVLLKTDELVKQKSIDALIIDPWNEIELSRPNNISESDFIGSCLRKARKFARRTNIHLFIIAHPTKLQRGKDGKYPIPELWDISGSAHWRNKCDNGICVHRDYEEDKTIIFVQKIKFKYCGRQGECYLKYENKSGRYIEYEAGSFNNEDDRRFK